MKALYCICLFTTLGTWLCADEIRISTRFHPATIMVGESSDWIVTIENANTQLPLDPAQFNRPGLTYLGSTGTQVSSNFINGELTIAKRFSYRFRASQAKEFVMPAIPVTIGGRSYEIPQTTLSVLEAPAQDKEEAEQYRLNITLPQSKIYVGQTFPISIEAFAPRDAEVGFRQQPDVQAEGFTEPRFGTQLERQIVPIDGDIVQSYKMSTQLTALQQGSHPVAADWEMILTLNDNPHRHRHDLFSDFFNRRQVSKVLSTSLDDVTVHPLPTENQPESFTGAIGMFSIKSSLQPQQSAAGEPITLTLKIAGEGNFDRIAAPQLPLDSNWKMYDPKSSFLDQPSQEHLTGYTGEKTFEYILIPKNEDITEFPSIAFSFFSPQDEKYIDTQLPPIPLDISPSPTPSPTSSTALAPNSSTPTPPSTETAASPSGLRPLLNQTSPTVSTLQPILKEPLFIIGNIALGFITSLLSLLRWQRIRQNNNPQALRLKASRQRLRSYQKEMPHTIDKEEWSRFLELCRYSLAELYFGTSERDPRSVTSSELIAEIKQDERLALPLQEQSQACLQAEDTHKYGGTITSSHLCKTWMHNIETIRKKIAS